MKFYRLDNLVLASFINFGDLKEISPESASRHNGVIYFLTEKDPLKSRDTFVISKEKFLFSQSEGIELLDDSNEELKTIPDFMVDRINEGKIISVNTAFPNWIDYLEKRLPKKWRVNIIGMGDVGGTLLSGLRLLAGDTIEKIGIYDKNLNNLTRWHLEASQIYLPFSQKAYPDIELLEEDEIFDCDMVIFCVSVRVPAIGEEGKDVRMVQFEGNSKVVSYYGKLAASKNFKGLFAVVSDPVDLLCKSLYLSSNTDEDGNFNFGGLMPEQIRGYGLGVMNARALFYSKQEESLSHYESEGRAFGPHGEGLIIADSIENYDDEKSKFLTEKAKTANLEVRSCGFKPYIAPALSSGALSILATLRGDWHYSSVFLGETFMGCKNRYENGYTHIEPLKMDPVLLKRLNSTYEYLKTII